LALIAAAVAVIAALVALPSLVHHAPREARDSGSTTVGAPVEHR
jgi:hypothetical protein